MCADPPVRITFATNLLYARILEGNQKTAKRGTPFRSSDACSTYYLTNYREIFEGFVAPRGWWFSRDHQLTLGLKLQVRFSPATSDGSGPLHTNSRRRTPKARRTIPGRGHTRSADQRPPCTPPREPPTHLRASPLGRYIAGVLFSSGILTLDTCRPLWGGPCPCTLSALFFISLAHRRRQAKHGEKS